MAQSGLGGLKVFRMICFQYKKLLALKLEWKQRTSLLKRTKNHQKNHFIIRKTHIDGMVLLMHIYCLQQHFNLQCCLSWELGHLPTKWTINLALFARFYNVYLKTHFSKLKFK